ncbi:MAG: glycogen synthase, partial [Acidobacteria bacterium]|nr:glycogen synthase [Acidobacteriota bacterium]
GGLDDSVRDFDLGTLQGNGFKFYDYSADRLMEKVYEALLVYYDGDVWSQLQSNGMREDFSWEKSARRYLDAYRRIVAARRSGF